MSGLTNTCNLGQAGESGEHELLPLPEIVTQLSEPENPVEGSAKDLSMQELMELKDNELKNKATKSHLAVALMNAISSKEQRTGRSAHGTKFTRALDSNVLSKIRVSMWRRRQRR